MAARVGFEPTGQVLADTQDFKSRPLWPLRHLAILKNY